MLDIVECMAKSKCPDWGVWGDVEVWESSFPNPAGSGYLRLRDLPTEVALGGKVIFPAGRFTLYQYMKIYGSPF